MNALRISASVLLLLSAALPLAMIIQANPYASVCAFSDHHGYDHRCHDAVDRDDTAQKCNDKKNLTCNSNDSGNDNDNGHNHDHDRGHALDHDPDPDHEDCFLNDRHDDVDGENETENEHY